MDSLTLFLFKSSSFFLHFIFQISLLVFVAPKIWLCRAFCFYLFIYIFCSQSLDDCTSLVDERFKNTIYGLKVFNHTLYVLIFIHSKHLILMSKETQFVSFYFSGTLICYNKNVSHFFSAFKAEDFCVLFQIGHTLWSFLLWSSTWIFIFVHQSIFHLEAH